MLWLSPSDHAPILSSINANTKTLFQTITLILTLASKGLFCKGKNIICHVTVRGATASADGTNCYYSPSLQHVAAVHLNIVLFYWTINVRVSSVNVSTICFIVYLKSIRLVSIAAIHGSKAVISFVRNKANVPVIWMVAYSDRAWTGRATGKVQCYAKMFSRWQHV